jgi:hypothetical protein
MVVDDGISGFPARRCVVAAAGGTTASPAKAGEEVASVSVPTFWSGRIEGGFASSPTRPPSVSCLCLASSC